MGDFQPLAQRASTLLADRPTIQVFAWTDEIVDTLGHDPLDSYCEQFWLPIVGPSVYLLGRRFVILLHDNPDSLTVPLRPCPRPSASARAPAGTRR
jgi:hypothetical protein